MLLLCRQHLYQLQSFFFFHSITRSLFLSRSTNATHTDIVYTPPSCNEAYINYTSSRLDQPADRYSVICRDLCLLLNLRKQALAVSQTLWILVMFAQGIKTDTPQESTLYNLPFVLPCHTRWSVHTTTALDRAVYICPSLSLRAVTNQEGCARVTHEEVDMCAAFSSRCSAMHRMFQRLKFRAFCVRSIHCT